MARGNQRDLARERNAKKQAGQNKGNKEGLSSSARTDRFVMDDVIWTLFNFLKYFIFYSDADIMRQKQLAAEQRKAEAAAAAAAGKKK